MEASLSVYAENNDSVLLFLGYFIIVNYNSCIPHHTSLCTNLACPRLSSPSTPPSRCTFTRKTRTPSTTPTSSTRSSCSSQTLIMSAVSRVLWTASSLARGRWVSLERDGGAIVIFIGNELLSVLYSSRAVEPSLNTRTLGVRRISDLYPVSSDIRCFSHSGIRHSNCFFI